MEQSKIIDTLEMYQLWSDSLLHVAVLLYDPIMLLLVRELALVQVWTLGLVSNHCNTICAPFYHLLPCFFIFILQKPISTIHTTLVSPSLRWTSAPIQFSIVFCVLGTQETFCYWVFIIYATGCVPLFSFAIRNFNRSKTPSLH